MEPKKLEADGWVMVGNVTRGLWSAFKRENWTKLPANENSTSLPGTGRSEHPAERDTGGRSANAADEE